MEENQFKKDNDRTTAGQLTAEEHNNIGQELNNMLKTHLGFDAEDLSQLAKGLWIEGRSLLYTDVSDVSNKIHLKRLSSEHKIEILKDGVSVFFQCRENSTGVVTIKLNETEEKPVNFRGVSAGLVDANKLYVGVTYLAVYRDGFDTTKEIGKWDLFEMSATLENVRFKRETTNNKVRIIVDDNAVPLSLSMNPGDNATEFEQGAIIAKSQASFLFSDVVAGNKNNKLGIKYEVESPGDDGAGNPLPEEHSLVFYAKNENKGFINMSTGYHNLKRRMPYGVFQLNMHRFSDISTSYCNTKFGNGLFSTSDSYSQIMRTNTYVYKRNEHNFGITSEVETGYKIEYKDDGIYFEEPGIYKVDINIEGILFNYEYQDGNWGFGLRKGKNYVANKSLTILDMIERKHPFNFNRARFATRNKTKFAENNPSFFYNGGSYIKSYLVQIDEDNVGEDNTWYIKIIYYGTFSKVMNSTVDPLNVDKKYVKGYGFSNDDLELAQREYNAPEPWVYGKSIFHCFYKYSTFAISGNMTVTKVSDLVWI